MSDDIEDDDDDREDRGLDEGQDPGSRDPDDYCAAYGCERDGSDRCWRCNRRMPPVLDPMFVGPRLTAKDRLARTRARAKERRALTRGRQEILRHAPMLRRWGYAVPRAVDLVETVVVVTEWCGCQHMALSRDWFWLAFPDARDTNENGCLHCDGSGCREDRRDCDHGF